MVTAFRNHDNVNRLIWIVLTRKSFPQVSWMHLRRYGLVLQRVVIITKAIDSLIASFAKPVVDELADR